MKPREHFDSFISLNEAVIKCRLCPRLVNFREEVPARASFIGQEYWRKPIPGFGDENAWLLILGLAPAAHGGNRTGRVFTGDESGRFLMKALYHAGFANQPTSESRQDGLKLHECFITASVKCVPPHNKPLADEILNCSRYYQREIQLLKNLKAVLALGKLAFDAYVSYAKQKGCKGPSMHFKHGVKYEIPNMPTLYGCYHPTPRNTYTKTLTFEMMIDLLGVIVREHLVD